ncbi:MAG TPA: multicopper oxidase family protein [Anaeromyxobacter sp.]|nr:multicopper oxidase family protein [Anaeromyxobacter sp.]
MTRSLPRSLPALLLLALAPAARADTLPATTCPETSPGARTCALFARSGTLTLPGGGPVAIWGYTATAAGEITSPGPVLVVNQGDTVTVSLANGLAVPTSLQISGQQLRPDLDGVPAGATESFTFVAGAPGTYVYEAGLLPGTQYQVAMGLYGVLVVRPAGAPLQAYADAATAFDDEAVIVLGELDPALNGAGDPAAFDMRGFAPRYWLINGHPYPDTAAIVTSPGRRVLLRYANAGLEAHAMSLLGTSQTTLAVDGARTPRPFRVLSQAVGAGQTADALVTVPSGAPLGARYPLYEGALALHNANQPGFGGMLTFLVAGAGVPGGGAGPTVAGVVVTPSPTTGAGGVTVTATATSAGSTIDGAEMFVDVPGANGTGLAMAPADGGFGGTSEGVTAAIPAATLAALATGAHVIYVHARDATGAWGPVGSGVLLLDRTGPAIATLVATPNPANGSVAVAVSATGDDRASGGANVVAAELFVDPAGTPAPGTGVAMAPGAVSDVTAFTLTLPQTQVAALSSGGHALAVRARDALLNWGPLTTVALVLDRTGPVASAVTVTPAVTDGRQGLSVGNASLRLTATLTDAASAVAGGEGFIDVAGADGTGFQVIAADGRFDETTEDVYADVPLATIVQLTAGAHTLLLHGRDASGNWGSTAAGTFVFTPPPPDLIFANGFESGSFAFWNGGTTGAGLAVTPAARLGTTGAYGMALTVGATAARYVTDGSPAAEALYSARFLFDPNSTGNANIWDIFTGVNGAQTLFRVQYRRVAAGLQLRGQILTPGGNVSTPFVTITDAPHAVEIVWRAGSGAGTRFELLVDGAVAGTLSGQNTSAYRIQSVRLGRAAGANGGATGTVYFDEFVSRRASGIGP